MTGHRLLYDKEIRLAALRGDNDEAYEYTILQRQYYERFCDSIVDMREWERRQKEYSRWRLEDAPESDD